jgi:hypothetical protein
VIFSRYLQADKTLDAQNLMGDPASIAWIASKALLNTTEMQPSCFSMP